MGQREALRAAVAVDDLALGGHNNFHLIRLVAALLVLFAHCYHLLGRAADEPIGHWFVWFDASLLGVSMFFFISGCLVARSWNIRRSLPLFLAARALRIAPALWLVLGLSVLLGAAVTTWPLRDYLHSVDTRKYLVLNAILYTHYLLPGVFESNPVHGINGSLWTIPLEVVLYLILGAAGWLGLLAPHDTLRHFRERISRHPFAATALLLLGLLLIQKVLRTGAGYYSLAGYFLLGMLAFRFRHWLVLRVAEVLLLAGAAIALGPTWAGPLLLPAAVGFTILTLALHPALALPPTWLHRHDYSYGAYLYGFPVQQSMISFGIDQPLLLFACCVPLTLACAALSWHLVEQPALAQKQRVSRWIARWLPGEREAAPT
ncbi:MAG: acyltransferase [Betaproteobacteria bacterium]